MSSILKCPACGLYFDQNLYAQCPNCHLQAAPRQTGGYQAPAYPAPGGVGRTVAVNPAYPAPGADVGRTVAVNPAYPAPGGDVGRTVAVMREKTGIDPVVGWLVCIDGAEKGADHRVRDGNNKIGRDPAMDICVKGDDAVSRKNEAILVYASEAGKFYLVAGDGENVVYVNGEPLPAAQARTLAAYDRIKLGRTLFLFIPLCGERFQWE